MISLKRNGVVESGLGCSVELIADVKFLGSFKPF